jgi:hypothetical protein
MRRIKLDLPDMDMGRLLLVQVAHGQANDPGGRSPGDSQFHLGLVDRALQDLRELDRLGTRFREKLGADFGLRR